MPRSLMRFSAVLLTTVTALSFTVSSSAAHAAQPTKESIVVLRYDHNIAEQAHQLAAKVGGNIHKIYDAALPSFVFSGSAQATQALARDSRVAYVRSNQADVLTQQTRRQIVAQAEQVRLANAHDAASELPWHLDRIDQRKPPLDQKYAPINNGSGTTIYVMDTGIRFSHQDFAGRALPGFDIDAGGKGIDCWGHGTVAADLAGGTNYGVAKEATLVAVKVIPCSSTHSTLASTSTASVMSGIEWLAKNAKKQSVVNVSLGYKPDQVLDDAFRNLINKYGITVVVSAGNGDDEGKPFDACQQSPSRVREAIVVGASTPKDEPTSFSNNGPCVDVFAPGDQMKSAGHGSDTELVTNQGTSEAAPMTAGLAALHLAAKPNLTPAELHSLIVNTATDKTITGVAENTTSKLIYAGR